MDGTVLAVEFGFHHLAARGVWRRAVLDGAWRKRELGATAVARRGLSDGEEGGEGYQAATRVVRFAAGCM